VRQREKRSDERNGDSAWNPRSLQRIAQLERENRELRRANDILKAASLYFFGRPSSTVARRSSSRSHLHRRPPGARFRWLRWGVEPICEVLEIAPSTYYDAKDRHLSARAERDAELRPKLRELWARNYSVYGRRRLTKAVKKAGLNVGRDEVARLMRAEGLRGASRALRKRSRAQRPGGAGARSLTPDASPSPSNFSWLDPLCAVPSTP
jgi:hypothetical protein